MDETSIDPHRLRIAVVDDEPDWRELVQRFLEEVQLGLVGEAEDADSALRMVEDACPDLVIVDFQMPGVDGAELTRQLLERHPDVEVVAFTSAPTPEIELAFTEAGAAALFRKADLDLLVTHLAHRAASAVPPSRRCDPESR